MGDSAIPFAIEEEKLILGSILLDDSRYVTTAAVLEVEDFGLEAHRRIFTRMGGLHERGESIDRVTVANELLKSGELESVGGLTYLCSLDDGLPHIVNIESYQRIVKDKSTLRRVIYACEEFQRRAMRESQQPAELLVEASTTWLTLSQRGVRSTFLTPKDVMDQGGGPIEYLDRSKRAPGLKTGFPGFDTLTGGLRPGGLYIFAARPRMGKTALLLNVADNVSVDHEDVTLIFSLEMDKEALVDRLICSRARVNTKRFEGGWMNADERRRAMAASKQIIDSGRILIDDRATTNMREIHAKIRQQQAKAPVALVVVDYLQLLIGGKSEHRVAEASKISRDMKLVAKDCAVPMAVLSQLSRECDKRPDPRPQLADLRETGSIEADADLVAFVFREEIYKRDRPDLAGLADLIVAKQRSGSEATIPMVFLKEFVRFEERCMEAPPQ